LLYTCVAADIVVGHILDAEAWAADVDQRVLAAAKGERVFAAVGQVALVLDPVVVAAAADDKHSVVDWAMAHSNQELAEDQTVELAAVVHQQELPTHPEPKLDLLVLDQAVLVHSLGPVKRVAGQ
jgi:hypothetical protein